MRAQAYTQQRHQRRRRRQQSVIQWKIQTDIGRQTGENKIERK